jgi:calcineurin-like phosphoesterase
MELDGIMKKFLFFQKMGSITVAEKGPFELNGIIVNVDAVSGQAMAVERVNIIDDDLYKSLVSDKSDKSVSDKKDK